MLWITSVKKTICGHFCIFWGIVQEYTIWQHNKEIWQIREFLHYVAQPDNSEREWKPKISVSRLELGLTSKMGGRGTLTPFSNLDARLWEQRQEQALRCRIRLEICRAFCNNATVPPLALIDLQTSFGSLEK